MRLYKNLVCMSREEIILKYIDKNEFGLEIGPSHRPIASKKDGFKVHTLDHLSKEGLIEKYKEHQVDTSYIEDVDFIWNGESFLEITGKPNYYKWIIASHVIEHTTDLVRFLISCEEVLSEDGVVSLVIPDKRFCFDYFRPLTSLGQVVDAYFNDRKIHSEGTVAEYYASVVTKNGHIAWMDILPAEYRMVHTLEEAKSLMNEVHSKKTYFDLHAWCFTPSSFRLLINDLHELGLISLQEVDFHTTVDHEFYLTLSRNGKGISESRMELFQKTQFEIKNTDIPIRFKFKVIVFFHKVIFKIKYYSRKVKNLFSR